MLQPRALFLLPLLAAPALAQLPAPTLIPRVAPRAAWTAVSTSGTSSTTVHQRADNVGAASASKLYVFGGCKGNNTATTLNDLWEFDAVAGTFTQLITNSATPAPATQPTHRGRAMVAWNTNTNKLVLFGGNTRSGGNGLGTPTLLNDTWEWDPITNTWTDVTPISGSPSPREHAAMTYDPFTGGMLMFGGDADGTGATPIAPNAETWRFLGGAWTQVTPLTTTPPARGNHSMMTRTGMYDDVVMCLGGDYSASPNNIALLDVWKWNGSDWVQLANGTTSWPHGTLGNQAVYDPIRCRIVVQGGQGLTSVNSALYGALYGGSPSNYCSEFDCVSNTWSIYANPTTGATPFNNNDPVIGRISRYFGGFVGATGKVYKVCGQNGVAGTGNPTLNAYAYQATALASVTPYGSGCTGPGGPLSLVAADGPWTTRSFQCEGIGFGPNSLGLALVGLTQVLPGMLPLNTLPVPTGGAGCDLLTTIDILDTLLPIAGTATYQLAIGDALVDPSLPGLPFFVQFAELEFAPFPSWTGTYSTNGLACVVGSL